MADFVDISGSRQGLLNSYYHDYQGNKTKYELNWKIENFKREIKTNKTKWKFQDWKVQKFIKWTEELNRDDRVSELKGQ